MDNKTENTDTKVSKIRVWARTTDIDEKVLKSKIYTKDERFDIEKFDSYLMEICTEFDIPTPIILKNHAFNFLRFNTVKFRASDFLEEVPFAFLILEHAKV